MLRFISVFTCVMAVGVASEVFAQPDVNWVERTSSGPGPRVWHSMAYDSGRGRCVFFGGFNGSSVLGDTWEWDGGKWIFRSTPGPSPRSNHAMAYDSMRGKMVLFGGAATGSANNAETWEWDGQIWSQRQVSGPSPRNSHTMAYDTNRGVTVLFGGDTFNGTPNAETWEWDGNVWTQRATIGPSPSSRYYHAMAYDSLRGKTVLFGGFGGMVGSENNETWEWDGAAWTLTSSLTPPPAARRYHSMAFDSLRGVCVLHAGGTDTFTESDVWEWDGTAWSRRDVAGPSYRAAHAMAFDIERGVVVMACGREHGMIESDTWELGLRCIATHPVSTIACLRSTIALSAVSGVEPATYAWRKDRVFVDAVANPTATQAILQLSINSAAASGVYDCVVSNDCGVLTSNPVHIIVCTADKDCSGDVSADDIFAFLDSWFAQNGQIGIGYSADFNDSQNVTADDIFSFLDAWFAQNENCFSLN